MIFIKFSVKIKFKENDMKNLVYDLCYEYHKNLIIQTN